MACFFDTVVWDLMERSRLLMLLLLSALVAGLSVPVFIYSRALIEFAMEEPASAAAVTSGEKPQDPSPSDADPAHSATTPDTSNTDASQSVHATGSDTAHTLSHSVSAEENTAEGRVTLEDRVQPTSATYKPPLIGSCKKMFAKLQRPSAQSNEPSTYKAFAFAYDGVNANCAEYVSDKSLKHAQAVVLKACQEERAHEKRYVPCFLYDVQ